jgi:DNA-formamidopyrimidine glycosylase
VSPDVPPDHHVHVVLPLDDGREIRFRDMRKFGRIGLYTRSEVGELETDDGEAGPLADLGPEPLEPSFTLRVFRDRLRGRRGRLKALLTDQSFVAGVGNIYADEALWRARLHPLRSAASLRPDDERRLYRDVRGILAEAVERRGSSIDDYTAPDGDGTMQERLDVYQREGQPCARCGRPIRRIVLGQRATHFCSFCQRLPAADRAGAARILADGRARERKLADRSVRRGPRWTEIAGEGTLGLTPDEAARAAARERTDRTRRAAATRRSVARDGSAADPSLDGPGSASHGSAAAGPATPLPPAGGGA